MTGEASRGHCQALEGDLVIINSKKEQVQSNMDHLKSKISSYSSSLFFWDSHPLCPGVMKALFLSFNIFSSWAYYCFPMTFLQRGLAASVPLHFTDLACLDAEKSIFQNAMFSLNIVMGV